jgi:hypothetical protein
MAFNPDEYLKGEAPSAASNTFDPDAYLKNPEAPEEEPGALGSFGREAVRSVVPGVTATAIAPAAARVATALVPAPLRPVAGVLGALGGAMATGMGVRKLQDVAADKVAPESMLGTKSAQADFETNPIASFGGSLIGMGRPSLSQPIGIARAIGTSEGRAGVAQVAKSLANKDARTALTQAVEAGEPGARRAMEDFGNLLGGAAGLGAQTGMELAQGRDLPTAAAMGVAGLAVKPWVGPGGVFLNGQKPKASSALETAPEAAPVEDGAPLETPTTPEEQQLVDDAIAGKSRAVEATAKAADVAEATGTMPETAKALRQQVQRVAREPVTPPVDPASTEPLAAAPKTRANKLTASAPPVVAPEAPVATANDNLNQRNWMLTRSKEIARQKDQPFTNLTEWAASNPEDFNQMAVEWRALQEGVKIPAQAKPKSGSARIPDEILKEGVAQSKTREEFAAWAKSNGYEGALRPMSGGQIGAEVYWDLNRSKVAPVAAPEVVAPEVAAPEVAAPAAPPVAPEVVAPVVPPVAPETIPPVAPKITKEAQTLADKLGIDVSMVRPNKQGNISRRDVEKWAKENPPKAEEPPAPENVVPEEEPPLAPETEDINTDLEIFPMQGNRQFPDTRLQSVNDSGIGLGLSPFRKNRFSTIAEAERALDDFDRKELNTFFDDVHARLGVWQPTYSPGASRATVVRENALVNLPDGYAATTATRYGGATGLNWMKVIETIKSVKSGNTSHLFKQRVGGPASLLEVFTNDNSSDYVNLRLREVGIKGATLVKDPETGTLRVYVLVRNQSQFSTAVQAVKTFVNDNNYGKIKSYRGDVDTVTPDIESATNFLRESLGEYTGGGSGDRAGGADRARVARDLWGLARDTGITLPEPPEYVEPQKRGTSLLQYEKSLADLKAAFEKVPPEKQGQFGQLFTRAYDRLAQALGQGRMRLQEVGSLLEGDGRSGNEVFELYAERLREIYSENDLVPDLVQRRNNLDAGTNYGVSYAERGKAFPKYNGQPNKDQLLQIALGKILDDLSKRVDEKALPARKTKGTLAKLEAIDKQIEKISSNTTRAKKLSKGDKAELARLRVEREKTANQQNPWNMEPKVFNRYVEGKLDNAVLSISRVEAKRAKAGLSEVEDTTLSGDDKEATSITEKAADEGEGADPRSRALGETLSIDPETRKAAYEALRNDGLPAEDRFAIGKKAAQSRLFDATEAKALEPDLFKMSARLDALDQAARERNEASKGNLGRESTARELGEAIADSYTLEEILIGEHRRKDGYLKRGTYSSTRQGDFLLSPLEEAAVPVDRDAPPQVIRETNAREFLAELLDSKSISSEDSALVRRLLDEANVDNIPLRIYDYLENAYGEYSRLDGVVGLNAETLTPDRATTTGLHEISHGLLGYFLNPRNTASLNARQRQVVGDLNRFFEQTREAAIRDGRFTKEQWEAVRAMAKEGTMELPTASDKEAYRFSSIDEWTAAMMSESGFRDYMKGLKMRNTVTGKWREAWETFKDLVARLFGVDRSVYKKSFDRIMELATDSDAGRPSGVGDVARDLSPMSAPRSTRKVSEAQVNERLSDKDKVMFDSQKVPPVRQAAMIWKSNGGQLEDLSRPGVPLSNPEIMHAAELFYQDALAAKVSVDRMKNPRAVDIAARRKAEDDIVRSMQLVGQMVSGFGQGLGHSQYIQSRQTINIQDVYKTLLGKTPEEIAAEGSASGKIDLQKLNDGIRQIKAKAADTTMLALEADLKQAGIEGAENLNMLRDALAHQNSSYRDLFVTVADLMPANNEAQTRALAERIFKIYTLTANKISKMNLPEIVADAYNGQTTTPATDKFLKKLSEFVKLGKYSEDEINTTVMESLGLSGYDKEFIASIRKDLFKIAAMPEGQMRDAASVEVNQKVKTKLYNNVLKFDPNTPQGNKHIMDMLTSAWQAGVLSGPPTSLVNLLGSASSITAESFMEGLGYALKTGDVRYLGDVYSGFISALLGNKATGRASSAIAEGKSALTGQGTKYRNESVGDTPTLENIDTTGTSAPVKLVGGYAKKLRYVGRVMSALDAVNMSMADEAKQRMVARFFLTESKGHRASEVADMMHKLFDPDEVVMTNARKQAEEDVKTYLSDKSAKEQERWVTRRTLEILTQQREELVPNIAEAGRGAAERFTYNETARGFIGKTMVNLSAQINETLPAGRFVLSFMNTLANIMNQTLDYTPYGYLRAKDKWRVGTVDPNTKYARRVYKEGSPEQMAQIARASLGTSVMMAVAYMAYKGYEDEQSGETPYFTVTGAGPKNSFDKQQLVDTGAWRPNSVKIGDTWFRYMDFPIVGAALGFMGTMLDAARYKKDDQTGAEVVWDAALAGATTVFDKQLFQGANNFFEMLRGGQPGQQVFALKRLVGGTVGGFTNPGMARWLRNTLDVDSKGMVDRLDQRTTAGWVASMIPFSIGYNTPALNTLGEPIQQPWYSATTWRFADFAKSKPHPIIAPLIQAGLMLPNPSPATQFRILNPSDGTIVKTRLGKYPEVLRRFVELRGQSLKQILTPEYVANLQQAAAQNQDAAQDYLDSKIGGAARDLAIRQVEQEIIDGKLKL